ncbi:alpha-ketoglutarate-dependent dioxygenase AlkB [Myroides sp. JBRI-B21084]|uniref:alpha-ketoglutarate-dependent dioxygenase AlkB family protein n=1 Tax=Myroides sp. JBRI-B21084 TaxID=3119977 RepID=UPI0026E36443|nr:alpha-ketoglutarate-dependent dioxygenase AlkB [Paenimyroides cloacae]WKW46374.1 alpha-ketoglutarate-dependent dioxygenase AlkB [Paenimyroides cloacae]
MDLFTNDIIVDDNLLPYGGELIYHGVLLDTNESSHFFDAMMQKIEWYNDKSIIYGKEITTKRKVAWYGSKDFSYTYSGVTRIATPWIEELLALKQLIELYTDSMYNSCLLNLYHSGEEGMAWHSDGEKDLVENGSIACLSLGAQRRFDFKHKQTAEKKHFNLPSGSVIEMKGETQKNWLHRIAPTKKVTEPRISLTFRQMKF